MIRGRPRASPGAVSYKSGVERVNWNPGPEERVAQFVGSESGAFLNQDEADDFFMAVKANGNPAKYANFVETYDRKNVIANANRKYARDFRLWLHGRHRTLNDPLVTPWGEQSLMKLMVIDEPLKAVVERHNDFQRKLMVLYINGPRTQRETEIYFRYLVWPIQSLLAEMRRANKYNNFKEPSDLWKLADQSGKGNRRQYWFPRAWWYRVPRGKAANWDFRYADDGNRHFLTFPMSPVNNDEQDVAYIAEPPFDPADRGKIPLAIHPAINIHMRPFWSLPFDLWNMEDYMKRMSCHFWTIPNSCEGGDDTGDDGGKSLMEVDPDEALPPQIPEAVKFDTWTDGDPSDNPPLKKDRDGDVEMMTKQDKKDARRREREAGQRERAEKREAEQRERAHAREVEREIKAGRKDAPMNTDDDAGGEDKDGDQPMETEKEKRDREAVDRQLEKARRDVEKLQADRIKSEERIARLEKALEAQAESERKRTEHQLAEAEAKRKQAEEKAKEAEAKRKQEEERAKEAEAAAAAEEARAREDEAYGKGVQASASAPAPAPEAKAEAEVKPKPKRKAEDDIDDRPKDIKADHKRPAGDNPTDDDPTEAKAPKVKEEDEAPGTKVKTMKEYRKEEKQLLTNIRIKKASLKSMDPQSTARATVQATLNDDLHALEELRRKNGKRRA